MARGRLPLTALRTFEAAGRLQSFTRAAEELFVSQAAVSRQVRDLETALGCALFERRHRCVVPTEDGRRLLAQLTASFDDIDRALRELRRAPAQQVLIVSADPSFAASWLVPHLDDFHRRHPDVDVLVEPDQRLVEFRSHGAEIGIRHSADATSWPRTRARRLTEARVTPLAAPALLAEGPPVAEPADLLRHRLLHEENRNLWTRWLQAAGVSDAAGIRGPLYADGALAASAAAIGHGIALYDPALAAEDIAGGRLVRPFDLTIAAGAYWLVMSDRRPPSEAASAFVAWIEARFPPSETPVSAPRS